MGGKDVWVWECSWVLCVSQAGQQAARPPGRLWLSTAARSITDIQRKFKPSSRTPVPRRKPNPDPIIPNQFPPPSHPRIYLLGGHGTSLAAGRVS